MSKSQPGVEFFPPYLTVSLRADYIEEGGIGTGPEG